MWGGGQILGRLWQATVTPIRTIYWAERREKGRIIRRFGFRDTQVLRGLLPRLPNMKEKLPIPDFKPKLAWSERKALFGQNDYIDILGSPEMHPTKLLYNVPNWLRGFGGHEYHMLIRRKKLIENTPIPRIRPTKYRELEKRIRYLYRQLNRKTRTFFSKKQ